MNNVCFGDSLGLLDISTYSNYNPCQYSINNSVSWQNNGVFDSLIAGNYIINIIDAIGCESDTNLTIIEPILLQGNDTINECDYDNIYCQ